MKRIEYPKRNLWPSLLNRPVLDHEDLTARVKDIINNVRTSGDHALFEYAQKFDQAELKDLKVSGKEFTAAENNTPVPLKKAIKLAYENIETFHRTHLTEEEIVQTAPGVYCYRKNRAVEKVGLYVPGGSAPLFSTVLMLGIPAMIAGCNRVTLCTPPATDGSVNPVILYTAQLVGITEVYKVGGAQAIAAMAFGTSTIPAVYKIFGPGNQYVTKAKELVQSLGVAIDMPAGPSEVLIIADQTANPAFVAADLLSQAEHGADSQVIFLATDVKVLDSTLLELELQLKQLPRQEAALKSLENSRAILFNNIDECFDFSNAYAPEHLILALDNASQVVDKVQNAGSVFLGHLSCESTGDYASGTNHTLPTNGCARAFSGLSVENYVKKITFQEITLEGLKHLGPAVEEMAGAEELEAHKNAVTIRLNTLKNNESNR